MKIYICLVCFLPLIIFNNKSFAQTPNQAPASKLPYDDPKFKGKIGRTYKESTMDWPTLPSPPQGAPNVIIILLDDVGLGMTSTFGGSIPTHLDFRFT